MKSEHKQWVRRAVTGDRDALGSLLETYGPTIETRLNISPVWQGSLDTADVMQVTYLEAFLQISRFDPQRPDAFPGWLSRIAENNLRDAIRALTAQKSPSPANRLYTEQGDSMLALYDILTAGIGTPSQALRRDEALGLLRQALRRLPDDYAQAIDLYDLQDMSVDQVAAALGRSRGAVHMLRSRGHDRLRELLGAPSRIFESRA